MINCEDNDSFKHGLSNALSEDKKEVHAEFENYRTMYKSACNTEDSKYIHIIFDFAEKVLLPHLLKKPGQLHFITGLKFDLFRVRLSNIDSTHIHFLTEGHWPNSKSANEVASMLEYSIDYIKSKSKSEVAKRKLLATADNCSEQNKNR